MNERQTYYVKNTENGAFADIAQLFDGVRVLKCDGMGALGEAKNVYTAEWEYSEAEDMTIVMEDDETPIKIIRSNVDIELTFIVRQTYASNTIDIKTQHDMFIAYMTDTDVWVKSGYMGGMVAHCVCTESYKPTLMKLGRGNNSFIMGTIKLHCLDKPKVVV